MTSGRGEVRAGAAVSGFGVGSGWVRDGLGVGWGWAGPGRKGINEDQ